MTNRVVIIVNGEPQQNRSMTQVPASGNHIEMSNGWVVVEWTAYRQHNEVIDLHCSRVDVPVHYRARSKAQAAVKSPVSKPSVSKRHSA